MKKTSLAEVAASAASAASDPSTREVLKETLQDVSDTVRDTVADVSERAKSLTDDATEQLNLCRHAVTDTVKARPFASLAAAAAFGFLVGRAVPRVWRPSDPDSNAAD